MTSTFRNRTFNYIADTNNPLGLLKPFGKDGKVYELLGYFHVHCGKELNSPIFGDLPKSYYGEDISKSFKLADFNITYTEAGGVQRHLSDNEKRMDFQLKHLGLNPNEIHYVDGNCGYTFIFTVHRKSISFKTVVTNCGRQAIWDYIHANENVPEIISKNLLAKEIAFASKTQNNNDTFWNQKVNKDSFENLVNRKLIKTELFTTTEEIENRQEFLDKLNNNRIKPETVFELNSDYDIVGKRLELDLFQLQKDIVSQAKRKGGFVDFTYKNIIYKIPKLPLMIWATKYSVGKMRDLHSRKIKFNNETWYTVCPEDLKTADDAPIHSDWWIGSGFPFEVYNLYLNKHSHQDFNKALTEFSMALIGKNTLEDVVFLAGKDLSPVTGKVVIYPESLDSFNEDDIIVLPNGGVDFDQYIKKACKNKKGAVILEVGNKVAHLSIVSREYNSRGFEFRLIMLPNASELLIQAKTATIEPLNGKIIPNKS